MWSPYQWPSGAPMSWASVGDLIVGAVFVLWWGMSDDQVMDAIYPEDFDA